MLLLLLQLAHNLSQRSRKAILERAAVLNVKVTNANARLATVESE